MIGQIFDVQKSQALKAEFHRLLVPARQKGISPEKSPHEDVFQYREAVKCPYQLIGPGDTQPAYPIGTQTVYASAIKKDFSLRGRINARYDIKQSGLSRTIRADQTDDFALSDGKIDLNQGLDPTEKPRNLFGLQHGSTRLLTRGHALDKCVFPNPYVQENAQESQCAPAHRA